MYLLMIWALVEESSLNLWLQWHVFAHEDVIEGVWLRSSGRVFSLSFPLRHLWFDILSWHPPSFRLQLFTPVLEQCRQFSKGTILWQFSVIFQIPICQGWNKTAFWEEEKIEAQFLLFITWIFPPLLELLWEPKSQIEAAHDGQL